VIRLLTSIYSSRVPEGFEICFCRASTQPHDLDLFLQRAVRFPNRSFTLIETSALSITLQEQLVAFMMERKVNSDGVRLHCIQSQPSILQPAPWIRHHEWMHDQGGGGGLLSSYAATSAAYKDLVVDGEGVSGVTVVSSALSASPNHSRSPSWSNNCRPSTFHKPTPRASCFHFTSKLAASVQKSWLRGASSWIV
jgi:hypothetical protein